MRSYRFTLAVLAVILLLSATPFLANAQDEAPLFPAAGKVSVTDSFFAMPDQMWLVAQDGGADVMILMYPDGIYSHDLHTTEYTMINQVPQNADVELIPITPPIDGSELKFLVKGPRIDSSASYGRPQVGEDAYSFVRIAESDGRLWLHESFEGDISNLILMDCALIVMEENNYFCHDSIPNFQNLTWSDYQPLLKTWNDGAETEVFVAGLRQMIDAEGAYGYVVRYNVIIQDVEVDLYDTATGMGWDYDKGQTFFYFGPRANAKISINHDLTDTEATVMIFLDTTARGLVAVASANFNEYCTNPYDLDSCLNDQPVVNRDYLGFSGQGGLRTLNSIARYNLNLGGVSYEDVPENLITEVASYQPAISAWISTAIVGEAP